MRINKELSENNNYEEFEKEDNEGFEKDKKRKKFIINGIMSLISCIIHTLGYFSIFIQKNFVVYIISILARKI